MEIAKPDTLPLPTWQNVDVGTAEVPASFIRDRGGARGPRGGHHAAAKNHHDSKIVHALPVQMAGRLRQQVHPGGAYYSNNVRSNPQIPGPIRAWEYRK
jgi:hypothetical protein